MVTLKLLPKLGNETLGKDILIPESQKRKKRHGMHIDLFNITTYYTNYSKIFSNILLNCTENASTHMLSLSQQQYQYWCPDAQILEETAKWMA